ncbi:MAG: peptidylprolyl isomerase [Sorangiineae bacterium]|nr:peptidylprolyl isomerase [Polyangiaceae bacterium]MEB2323329.1 peptidylprolyl isomerase [Sorangiineae bacterium]
MSSRRALVAAALLAGCARSGAPDDAKAAALGAGATLPDGVVAVVAGEPVRAASVREIALREGVTLEAARRRALTDALFAAGARERLAGTGRLSSAIRGALARTLLESLAREARAAGPPTDDEVARFTAAHWFELDRPPMARTVHAVVVPGAPAADAGARALAERIARAVAGLADPEAFMKAAREVPAGGLRVVIERLPACAADGRVHPDEPLAPGAPAPRFEVEFAKAANALTAVGELSPVVRSPSGYHVILLLEKIAAHRVPLAERRVRLSPEVMDARAASAAAALTERLSSRASVSVERSAIDLTSRVRLSR